MGCDVAGVHALVVVGPRRSSRCGCPWPRASRARSWPWGCCGAGPSFGAWQATLGVGAGVLWAWVGVTVAATALFALGIAGRMAALVLVAAACLDITAYGFSWAHNALLLVCAILVLEFGSGRGALWAPEEELLRRRAGERPGERPDAEAGAQTGERESSAS
ncbi:MAG: hypothetical protein R2851_16405 [Caldilineaceae bacterium]